MTDSRRRWLSLVFISVAVSLIIVDSTIVNVAVPSIVEELDVSSTQVQWIQESYTLVFASLLLFFGTLADRVGRRRLLLVGVVLFALSSVFAAIASTTGILILARLVQGIGGAMILPTTLSIINATFQGRERSIAFAVWGSTIGGMAAVGPLLGGWLTTAFSWRGAFGINIPFGILIIIGVLLTVRGTQEKSTRSLDGIGAVISVVLFATLVFGLIEGRTLGWWTTDGTVAFGSFTWPWALSPVPVAFAVTVMALIAFILWGRHRIRAGKAALLEFSLFGIASFRNGNLVALVVSLGEFGIILSLPLYLQFVLGFDALQTGLVLLALAVGSFFASGIAAALGNKVSAVWIVRTGLIAEIVGIAVAAFVIRPDGGWGWLLPALFVYGFGVGLATAQLTGVVLQDVPVRLSGQGSGAQSTSRQVGSALGIAILGTVLYTSTAGLLASSLDDRGITGEANDKIVSAVIDSSGAAIAGLADSPQTADAADAAKQAFTDGTRNAALTAAGFLTLGLFATGSLGRGRGSDADEPKSSESGAVARG
ncbi:DHA2 family efflux MFS transporter permease subunit [uncultured Microbacterium sp.]|uniref:DHA2 family efflux MFS transporter permease subunit n=1 Tax=uncultured Microbacterium sp. TaxID=191216 RepID=UPI002604AB06|nr:DHA2 family efflux MFS transporter permease subunit [uncultured Microbacterium sp.]